jgi:hypothetical protein
MDVFDLQNCGRLRGLAGGQKLSRSSIGEANAELLPGSSTLFDAVSFRLSPVLIVRWFCSRAAEEAANGHGKEMVTASDG